MNRLLHLRPSPAMVVACAALFVSLGGVGYAAIVLPANSVGTKQLKRNAVNSAKVKKHSLLRSDFKRGQVPRGPRVRAFKALRASRARRAIRAPRRRDSGPT